MKILKLTLLTSRLEDEKVFYNEVLGFSFLENEASFFTIRVGWSELTFRKSQQPYVYHYCFLIPSNRLEKAIDWLEQRSKLIKISPFQKIQRFEEWKSNSIYFFDASGNISELIAIDTIYPTKLGYPITDFSIQEILGINEIGMPTLDIKVTNALLEQYLETKFWKGDTFRFGTNGDRLGRFLLPNYSVKKAWFPTDKKVEPVPFDIVLENNGKQYHLSIHSNGKINVF